MTWASWTGRSCVASLLARQKPPEAAEAGMAVVIAAVGVVVAVAVAAAAAAGGGTAGQTGCFPGVGGAATRSNSELVGGGGEAASGGLDADRPRFSECHCSSGSRPGLRTRLADKHHVVAAGAAGAVGAVGEAACRERELAIVRKG